MKDKIRVVMLAVSLVVIVGVTTAIIWIQEIQQQNNEEDPLCLTPSVSAESPENEPIQDGSFPVELLGLVTFDTGARFAGTEIGGLSSITYDEPGDVYLVLSDDRGRPDNPRFYTVSIATDGSEVTFTAVTFLLNEEGSP